MPRKAFQADLKQAVAGLSIPGISNVEAIEDGEFSFQCSTANGETLRISALVPELSDYPNAHTYTIFTEDDAPKEIAAKFLSIQEGATCKTIVQLLEMVAARLISVDRDGDRHMIDSQEVEEYEEEDDTDQFSEEEYFPEEHNAPASTIVHSRSGAQDFVKPTSSFRQRIRADLKTAKDNGFKVGHFGDLMDGTNCYVSISIRISKLGISEEAMQAWKIEPNEYLVLLLHYPNGYRSMETYRTYDTHTARLNLEMRVGICHTYKPSLQEAIQAFTVMANETPQEKPSRLHSQPQNARAKGFRDSFISRPLNELLSERFATLISYRYRGMPWGGAEDYYNDNYGAIDKDSDLMDDKYMTTETVSTAYPEIATADQIMDCPGDQDHSLPLIAMQFVLRHFVRCTEFCLVCFTKLSDDLQAIKPYVCDKPLCLYQYMSLGFGPSIEYEILSQPKVVDLLISFCYLSARSGRLKDFPTGLSLMVPSTESIAGSILASDYAPYAMGYQPAPPTRASSKPADEFEKSGIRYNAQLQEMIFDDSKTKCPFKVGDWIILKPKDGCVAHCRIVETSYFPTVKVSSLIPVPAPKLDTGYTAPQYPSPYKGSAAAAKAAVPQTKSQVQSSTFLPAVYHKYDRNFDDLEASEKRSVIHNLLDILPSVAEMGFYLTHRLPSLRSWSDRLPPALLGLLRWIIASNRACIIQVDGEQSGCSSRNKGEDRLYGMKGWTQFRFAMGAPDKERRFINSVRATSERLKLPYPTLFAWHGSPLWNWHSIIREGLHFKDTAHGRAYGHGVYHSLEINTSLGYSGYSGYSSNGVGSWNWPPSDLKMSSALALNEIVNAPQEFVSSSPHLVVAQLDWIQTRYLFVQNAATQPQDAAITESKPLECVEQDPKMTPRGSSDKLIIPINAIAPSRRSQPRSVKRATKRYKASGKSITDPIDLDADDNDDAASVATLEEDLAILADADEVYEEAPAPTYSGKGKSKAGSFLSKIIGSKATKPAKPQTDFVPGSLEYYTLPILEPPIWATTSATKRLQQDLQELLKIQSKQPLHELGWYIDPDHVSNLYQWIVELHSFDPSLPLAKDMKSRGVKSVVMELRFGKDYPMSPPFVRVIRPRFLGFHQGGGGHVTAGGAMCMELLTNNGWSAVMTIEAVLLQVRMEMSSLDPQPARLENGSRSDYGVGEAVDAYIRACNVHGWTVPPGFREMALGGTPTGTPQGGLGGYFRG